MENKELLRDYLENFYGYGNPNSDYWFIGLEEGDLTEGNELDVRLNNWKNEVDEHFMDVEESHKNLLGRKFYVQENHRPVKNQSTISRAVKIFLILSGRFNKEFALLNNDNFQTETLKYQGKFFARKNKGETAILELYPLPCHKVSTWVYGDRFSKIPWLSDKRTYMDYMNKTRIPRIFDLIKEKNPKFVVLYSKRKDTEVLISNLYYKTFNTKLNSKRIGKQDIMYGFSVGTVFFFTRQISPQAGMSNEDLYSISEEMKKFQYYLS